MRTSHQLTPLVVLVVMAGCSAAGSTPRATTFSARTSGSSASASVATSSGTVEGSASPDTRLRAAIAALEHATGARIGVAITPVGRTAQVWQAGTLRTQTAWSTSKVPLSVALLRTPAGHTSRATSLMRRAITASDNAAADQLYAMLGSPAKASAATQAVVREAGDHTTVVPSTRRRAGYSIYGQTVWPAAAQARFLGDLTCRSDAKPVLTLMGQVVDGQRWGLGTLPRARFKGGWGPAASGGRYEVRQMGVVTVGGRQVAVALLADHVSFAQGTRLMTQLAGAVARNPLALPAARC